MSTNLQTHSELDTDPGLSALLTGIYHDIQELLKQQMRLFKHEVNSDLRKTAEAALALVAGAVVVAVGVGLLCLMLVYLLNWAVPALPLWSCFGLVGAVFLGIGAGLTWYGRSQFRSFNTLPEESLAALRENLEWTTKPR
jgi:hypothetical protein